MDSQSQNYATVSLKSLGASKALIKEVHELKSLNLSADKLLTESIKFISQSGNQFVKKFTIDMDIMMKFLNEKLPPNDHYILWTKYFNLAVKLKNELIKSNKDEDDKLFDEFQAKLVEAYNLAQDWKVILRLKQLEGLFNLNVNKNVSEIIFKGFEEKILSSLDFILWHGEIPYFLNLTQKVLKKLYTFVHTSENKEEIVNYIINGRFEKGKFFEKTLIIGEDGGLYMLLNSLEGEELEELKKIAGDDYIKDKIKENNKVIIGTGAFGTVRFALALFETKKALPGQIICIKKTKTINYLEETIAKEDENLSKEMQAIHYVIDSTIGDYFSTNEEITDLIYSPQVIDLSLFISANIPKSHRKGYLMMEIVPQNTGTSVLLKNKTPLDWVSDQKPYIKQVFEQINALLQKNIAMTDLKPDNTLYDIDNKRAFIIDLGGSLKIEEGVEQCKMKNHDFQFTPFYQAPEVKPDAKIIDLKKALAYSCGKILQQVVNANNPNEELLKISEQMMKPDPKERMSIEDGLSLISKIGDDKLKNDHLFEQYIRKIKSRLENNRSSIAINEDIYEIKELLIPPQVIRSDPDIFKADVPMDLQEQVDEFLRKDPSDSNLFLLLGNAGSGKSIFLQIEFLKAVYSWNPSKPLPIYFNLANGTNLKYIINSLDSELKINLYDYVFDRSVQKSVTMFIDSFDEGIYKSDSERENLIKEYFQLLNSKDVKFFISCRTNYLAKFEAYDKWFIVNDQESPQIKNKFYIIPFTYEGRRNLESGDSNTNVSYLGSLIKFYIEKISKTNQKTKNWSYYYEMIQNSQIESEITTGFIFQMVMKIYLYFNEKTSHENGIENLVKSKVDIFRKFIYMIVEKNLNHQFSLTKNQIESIIKDLKEEKSNDKIEMLVIEIGKYIAKCLHVKGEFRLRQDDKLFEYLDFKEKSSKVNFENQKIYYVLRNLPLKIEVKTEKNGEKEIAIGFIHDTIKNYFLFEVLKQEAMTNKDDKSCSKILGARNFVEDSELIMFLRDGILEDHETNERLTKYLLNQIYLTRDHKDEEYINSSANSATILIAAQYVFSNQDLSNTIIRRANLRNGSFEFSKLNNTDLRESKLINTKFNEVEAYELNLSNVDIGMNPDLEHADVINDIQFSPDGKLVVTCSNDSSARIWEISTCKQVSSLQGHNHIVNKSHFSPDGKYLATCSRDKTAIIWEVSTGKRVLTLQGHTDSIHNVQFSPDGKYLATCSQDKTAKIWEFSTGRLLQNLPDHNRAVLNVSFSPDGNYLATCSFEKNVRLWEVPSGKPFKVLEGHLDRVKKCVFSKDGKILASCSSDKTAIIWELSSGLQLHAIKDHTGEVTDVNFSSDGKFLITSSQDSTAKIWETSSAKILQTLQGHSDQINCVIFSPDEKYLATCSNDMTVKMWDFSSGKIIQAFQAFQNYPNQICFSPDGKYLAACYPEKSAKLWEVTFNKKLQHEQGHSQRINYISLSSNNRYLASCSGDKSALIWDFKLGKQLKVLQGHSNDVSKCIFSPDGQYVATYSSDKSIRTWAVSTGKQIQSFIGHTDYIKDITFSPDGNLLASCSKDQTARIWETASGKETRILKMHSDETIQVLFSPDGQCLATCSADTVTIWEVSSGKPLHLLKCKNQNVNKFTFSPDGNYLATSSYDNIAKIWAVSSGSLLHTLKAHTNQINQIEFSPDGKYLATCSTDNTAIIWEVSSGKQHKNLKGHTDWVRNLSFFPNGKYLATTSGDRTIRIWEVSSGKEMQVLRGHVGLVSSVLVSSDGKYLATQSGDQTIRVWKDSFAQELQNTSFIQMFFKTEKILANERSFNAQKAKLIKCKITSRAQKIFAQNNAVLDNPQIEDSLLPEPSKIISHFVQSLFDEFRSLEILPNRSFLEIIKVI